MVVINKMFVYAFYQPLKNVYNNIREVASECFRVAEQQGVDKSKQLHHSLVLAQVFMAFQQKLILMTIAACTHTQYSQPPVVFQLQMNTVGADLNFCSPWPGNHGYQSVCHTVKSSHHDDSTFHMFVQMYEVVREDCQARKLNKEDAMDRCKWRKMIKDVR